MALETVESTLVAPSEETPKHNIWLSNLDLELASRGYTPTIYLYRPNGDPKFFSVDTLKDALAKALVHFYPLAGRVAINGDGRLAIQCTGEGVLFVVARSTSTLDANDFRPSKETSQIFAPSVDSSEHFCIMHQTTFFKCGGVCLGVATHHAIMDGPSAIHFLNTWSDIARGIERNVVLSLDRTLLRARSPPTVIFDHVEYQRKLTDQPTTAPFKTPAIAILKVSKDQLACLKNSSGGRRRISTVEAVTAHVWRCACKAREVEADEETRLYITVDVRSRLKPPLPSGYFGNAILRTSVAVVVGDILSGPLHFVADKVHDTVACVDNEYIRSNIDFLELMDDIRGINLGSWQGSKNDLWVVSWLHMPMYELDFQWGKPVYMGRAHKNQSGMLYPMQSPEGDGGITLMMTMEPDNMPQFMEVFYKELDGLMKA